MRPGTWTLALCAAWAPLAALAEAPKLVNEKPVFTGVAPAYKTPGQYHVFSMRLSPSGKHLLYPRVKGEAPKTPEGATDWQQAKYEMILRDLGSGKEVVLPVNPLESGWRTGFTRFNLFDPTGQWLALANITVQREKVEHGERVRTGIKVVLYQVDTGKTTPTGLEGAQVIAKFDRTGKGLIGMDGQQVFTAALSGAEKKVLKAEGFLQSVCPSADVICVWAPPKLVRSDPGRPPERGPERLFLYDVKGDKEIAELPVNQRNSGLDDWETQWTPDGRYLYYYDVREVPVNTPEGVRQRTKTVAGVWDRTEGKRAAEVLDGFPVGPGPTPISMWLAKRTVEGGEGGFLLHDAESGKEYPLGDAGMKLIHAYGSRIVYAKPGPDGTETVFAAEVALPAPQADGQ